MLNRMISIGNLGKDPEVRFIAGAKAVARLSVATSEAWTDGDGKRQERHAPLRPAGREQQTVL